MRHRIFIAINLPEDIKKRLVFYQEKIEELFAPYRNKVSGSGPVRWTKKENIHITLVFLGYVSDEELLEVCETAKKVASEGSSFSINLKKIIYGPPKKMPPRMIWAEGVCSELAEGKKIDGLSRLQKDLENSLLTSSTKEIKSESRPYTSHITLGRIRQWEFRAIEPEERPIVDEDISLSFSVNSIEVMESQLKKGGSKYTVLESIPLKL